MVNILPDLNNPAFSTSPAIPAPSQGLGAAGRHQFSRDYHVIAGISDASGDPGDPGNAFRSFFSDGEYFRHIELGWTGSWENRFSDNIHLTARQVDDRWGVTLSFGRNGVDRWLPILRGGYSDGVGYGSIGRSAPASDNS